MEQTCFMGIILKEAPLIFIFYIHLCFYNYVFHSFQYIASLVLFGITLIRVPHE